MASQRGLKSGGDLRRIIGDLNIGFDLDLPLQESSASSQNSTIEETCMKRITHIYWKGNLASAITQFADWESSLFPGRQMFRENLRDYDTIDSLSSAALRRGFNVRLRMRSEKEKGLVYEKLGDILSDNSWMIRNSLASDGNSTLSPLRRCSFTSTTTVAIPDTPVPEASSKSVKRKQNNNSEVFSTAPSSPILDFDTLSLSDNCDDGDGSDTYTLSDFANFEGFDFDFAAEALTDFDGYGFRSTVKVPEPPSTPNRNEERQPKINSRMKGTKCLSGPNLPNPKFFSSTNNINPDTSFASTTVTVVFADSHITTPDTSFESIRPNSSFPKYPIVSIPTRLTLLDEERRDRAVIDLAKNGPFSKRATWFKELPLRYRYEAERVARGCGISFETIDTENTLPEDLSYDAFWQMLYRGSNTNKLERSKHGTWNLAVGNFIDSETHEMVVLSGELEWGKNGSLILILHPLKVEKSHRFARRYGADRFMEITIPMKNDKSGRDAELFVKAISKWLSAENHYLFGRIWRAFYIEDLKSKSKAKSPGGAGRKKVFLFAVDGDDFLKVPPKVSPLDELSESRTPMTVEQLVNWHILHPKNKHQEDCKLFNRIRLGLSRTTPTITLRPEEVIYDNDPRQEQMSDGCALISKSLGKAITDSLGLSKVPACFQGRFAGAKGIWIVARDDQCPQVNGLRQTFETDRGYWMVINASQLKVKPPPCDRDVLLDKHQMTFDVSSYARTPQSVYLNTQFLMVLQNAGINKEYLSSIIQMEADKFYDGYLEIIRTGDSAACRDWIKRMGGSTAVKATVSDGFPPDTLGQIIMLLDAGFLPSKLYFLRKLFKFYFDNYLQKLGDLKIKIPKSTYVYCIADPYGVLEEGEVHLAPGDNWEDTPDLDGIDILVARAPAHLPSDIQKCRAIFHPALRHLKGVAIFSTKGDVPLASLLSGGDYDGDEVWACWEPGLVNPFRNQPFQEIPKPEKYGLIKVSQRVGNMPFNEFMDRAFLFNTSQNSLGICTNEHERFCYNLGGIGSPSAVDFSCLLSHLADTRKSGYEYPAANRLAYRRSIGPATPDNPAYKNPDIPEWKADNILDCLKFEVIKNVTNKLHGRLNKDCPSDGILRVDGDLVAIWNMTWNRANQERNMASNKDKTKCTKLLDAIQGTRKQVERACQSYMANNLSYGAKITLASEILMAIQPPEFDHKLSIVWRESENEWKKLLASCAYHSFPESLFPWHAAAKILCEIKCRAVGSWHGVTSPIYQVLDVSTSKVKKAEAERRKAGPEDLLISQYFDEQAAFDDDDDWFSVA
ncbi:hypothetical protein MferCBS31731_006049 [Microsporum ferrugineum]